jgi:hypothetical protein
MERSTDDSQSTLLAGLNDLLQLDYDAVQAYTLAIESLSEERHQRSLIRYRGDHQRHTVELSRLIRRLGGEPLDLPHLPSGAFKLAVQAAGAAGGDRAVLLAFKSNDRQVRDKYRRAAEARHAPEVAEILCQNAEDEERHYAWVSEVLEEMGVGEETATGAVAEAFETVHARTADAVESAERKMMEAGERRRERRS